MMCHENKAHWIQYVSFPQMSPHSLINLTVLSNCPAKFLLKVRLSRTIFLATMRQADLHLLATGISFARFSNFFPLCYLYRFHY